jgi:hypothetical protein
LTSQNTSKHLQNYLREELHSNLRKDRHKDTTLASLVNINAHQSKKLELAWLDRGYTTQSTENKNMNVTRKIITETETLKSVIDQQSIKN